MIQPNEIDWDFTKRKLMSSTNPLRTISQHIFEPSLNPNHKAFDLWFVTHQRGEVIEKGLWNQREPIYIFMVERGWRILFKYVIIVIFLIQAPIVCFRVLFICCACCYLTLFEMKKNKNMLIYNCKVSYAS